MSCPECHDLLQQRLDGEAPADRAALDRHLAECPACREDHAAAQRLVEGMRLLARPTPSPGLASRVVARVLADQRAALRYRRRLWTAAAVAAGLVLAALFSYQGYRAGLFGTEAPAPVAKDQGPARDGPPLVDNKHQPGPEPSSTLGEVLDDARTFALDLTRRTADETVGQALHWLPPANPFAVPVPSLKGGKTLAPVLDPLAESLRQAGRTVTAGLKPVTTSAPRALDLLLQQMPAAGGEG
jgi:hypothetical protein